MHQRSRIFYKECFTSYRECFKPLHLHMKVQTWAPCITVEITKFKILNSYVNISVFHISSKLAKFEG